MYDVCITIGIPMISHWMGINHTTCQVLQMFHCPIREEGILCRRRHGELHSWWYNRWFELDLPDLTNKNSDLMGFNITFIAIYNHTKPTQIVISWIKLRIPISTRAAAAVHAAGHCSRQRSQKSGSSDWAWSKLLGFTNDNGNSRWQLMGYSWIWWAYFLGSIAIINMIGSFPHQRMVINPCWWGHTHDMDSNCGMAISHISTNVLTCFDHGTYGEYGEYG